MSAPQAAYTRPAWCEPWCTQLDSAVAGVAEQWCDTTCAAVDHLGVPTTWQTRAAEFELPLRRRDEFAEIPEQRATEVSLWMASGATDDAGVQAYLTPADLRATARQLLVFAALAETDGAPADGTAALVEVAVPDLDLWRPAHDHDAGCDVLHMTPDDAMDLVTQLLDKVHDVDPGLCCGELPAQGGARHE